MSEPRKISLTRREGKVTNWNPRRERHGDENAPIGDLNVTFLMSAKELEAIIKTSFESPGELFWDLNGEPELLNIEWMKVCRYEAEGELVLVEPGSRKTFTIEDCLLHKISIKPVLSGNASISAQFTFDPIGHSDAIHKMATAEQARFSFKGSEVLEDEDAAGDEKQGEMNLTNGQGDEGDGD